MTTSSDTRPISFSGGVKSISDDDICSTCTHCQYKPGEMSGCDQGWPGLETPDGYVVSCDSLEMSTDAGEGKASHEFTFDMKLLCSVRVTASTREEAEEKLRKAFGGASCNGGAWENGDPILFEASVDGAIDLLEIDGEGVD